MQQQQHSSARKAPARRASAALGWFKLYAFEESAVIDMAPAHHVALRHRLRLQYWTTDCKPLTWEAIAMTMRKMAFAEQESGAGTGAGVESAEEVLTPHYGFSQLPDGAGWSIPDLLEAHGEVTAEYERKRIQASRAGQASGAKRREGHSPSPATVQTPDPAADEGDF